MACKPDGRNKKTGTGQKSNDGSGKNNGGRLRKRS